MINKNDCMSILVKMGDAGLDVNGALRKLALSKEVPLEVLKFIAQNRGIEINNFYEMLRKKHNEHKSKLYTNIVRELADDMEIITTLTCLLVQIELYSKKLEDRTNFYKEARTEEIARAIHNYFDTSDITLSATLLKLIRSDILVLEYIAGRRDLQ